jgi:hypothetical protein
MADLVILRGVDWSAFGALTAAGAAIGMVGIVLSSQTIMLFVVSSALLAAGAAFVLDERASEVADVTASRPRQIRVRTGLLALPLSVSGVLAAVAPAEDGVTRLSVLYAFSGALLLSFSIACSLRKRSGLPGLVAATGCLAVTLMPAVFGGLSPIQTFPGTGSDPLVSSDSWWTISDACCLVLLLGSARRFRFW